MLVLNKDLASGDFPRMMASIKCAPSLSGAPLPAGYNAQVMRVKRLFAEEVKHMQAERDHTLPLTLSQRYVLRELQSLFSITDDEDAKARINLLERAFRRPITGAVRKELNALRRNNVTGQALLTNLAHIFRQYRMQDRLDASRTEWEDLAIPRIICSEALV